MNDEQHDRITLSPQVWGIVNDTSVPSDAPQPVQAHVTVSAAMAGILRDLAALDGRTPEALAIESAAGKLVIPEGTVGDVVDDWGLFDGPRDLASRVHEYLRGGSAA
ncbi:hypothetical protein ACFY1U_30810 [Streptomyces sp. NPDC001351]|uniref:hypothetical protein n=1 Tax=Streptomyces sp. NPDC001351 TaxID=3364564 RepID=UPI0036AB04EF